ncbi:hypothetical protein ACSBR2_028866 [Camellia fascicularis]
MPALFDDECLGLEAANILLTLQIPIQLSDSSNQLFQNPIDESESQSRNQLVQNPNDESESESRNQVQVRWATTRRRTEIALQNAGRAETETKPLVKDEDASNPITPLVLSPSVSHDNFNHFPEKVSKKKRLLRGKGILLSIYILEGMKKLQDWEMVVKYQRKNGSLFNSPSTTAAAFINLEDAGCLNYLNSLLEKFENTVSKVWELSCVLGRKLKVCWMRHTGTLLLIYICDNCDIWNCLSFHFNLFINFVKFLNIFFFF